MSKELDARLAALIECCDETDRLIIDTRRFADLEDENAKLREQGERLFDKTLELATENVRLQDENARLRSCLSDDAENARMILAENEKLRELVRAMVTRLAYADRVVDGGVFDARLRREVAKLGIEMDDA